MRPSGIPIYSVVLNDDVYKASVKPQPDIDVVVNATILIKTVNGAYQTNELEGNQLLIGGHCLYNNDIVAKVIGVTKHTCHIEIVPQQPNIQKYKEKNLTDVPIGEVKAIEAYGVSVYDFDKN